MVALLSQGSMLFWISVSPLQTEMIKLGWNLKIPFSPSPESWSPLLALQPLLLNTLHPWSGGNMGFLNISTSSYPWKGLLFAGGQNPVLYCAVLLAMAPAALATLEKLPKYTRGFLSLSFCSPSSLHLEQPSIHCRYRFFHKIFWDSCNRKWLLPPLYPRAVGLHLSDGMLDTLFVS